MRRMRRSRDRSRPRCGDFKNCYARAAFHPPFVIRWATTSRRHAGNCASTTRPHGKEIMLEVDSISKSFRTVQAVERLSFTVERGRVFGLLGPNGAGKTTTI